MSDDITSRSGTAVGQWDGKDVNDLKQELARIKRELISQGAGDKVEPKGVPHQEQMPEDLHDFTAYIIWACDQKSECLVGSGANRTESVASIREFYANDIAKDALARKK